MSTYKCVNCGHKVKAVELASIRCPLCDYKGLEQVSDLVTSDLEAIKGVANPPNSGRLNKLKGTK